MAVEDGAKGGVEVVDGVQAGHLAGGDQRGEHGPVLGAYLFACEERVFPRQAQFPFILPMSGRLPSFTIGGTRILALKFVSFALYGGAMDILLRLSVIPGLLLWHRLGCLMRRRVRH